MLVHTDSETPQMSRASTNETHTYNIIELLYSSMVGYVNKPETHYLLHISAVANIAEAIPLS